MKKRFSIFVLSLFVVLIGTSPAMADKPISYDANGVENGWNSSACTTIQSGSLKNSAGETLTTGFDKWGYNYQAHMFNGLYCDSYRNASWCQPYADVELIMKWNDAWLANVDCDSNGLLDRHNGFSSYIGSGAWETNHQKGTYLDSNGQTCHWEYFVKIIAAPADAEIVNGVWYTAGGIEIGPVIWGEFATIQSVYNDPCAEATGKEYLSPDHAGFGGW